MRVAVGGLDLNGLLLVAGNFQHRNVKSAAAKVVDGDLLVLLLVKSVGKRGGGWLVDDATDLEARNLARVLGCLSLRIVKIGGNGNHCFLNLLTKLALGVADISSGRWYFSPRVTFTPPSSDFKMAKGTDARSRSTSLSS